jgi:hypothetical protein
MSYATFEAQIDHGKVTVSEPEKLPVRGRGLLIVLPPDRQSEGADTGKQRVQLPLIRGDGKRPINPTPEELDASLWD